MRKIKFRGQQIETKEWRYGYLSKRAEYNTIREQELKDSAYHTYDVFHDTVGQYTGRNDKNGVEIYEGDIVKVLYNQNSENYAGNNFHHTEHICIVEFSDYSSSFVLRNITEKYKGKHNFTTIKFDHRRLYKDRIEVIGNIHSNPELLK